MSLILAEVWKQAPVVNDYLSRRKAIPMVREQIEVMLDVLVAGGAPVARFLDLGCGDGVLGAALLERFPESRGVLLDFSEPMLAQAGEFLGGLRGRVDFLQADYSRLGRMEQLATWMPFDAVVSGYSIHHQTDADKHRIYREIFTLLRPGGWFVNIEHVAPVAAITTHLFDEHFISQHLVEERQRGGQRTREEIVAQFHQRPDKAANILAPVDEQCAWLRQIGFREVDCFFKIHELAVFGGQRPPSAVAGFQAAS